MQVVVIGKGHLIRLWSSCVIMYRGNLLKLMQTHTKNTKNAV